MVYGNKNKLLKNTNSSNNTTVPKDTLEGAKDYFWTKYWNNFFFDEKKDLRQVVLSSTKCKKIIKNAGARIKDVSDETKRKIQALKDFIPGMQEAFSTLTNEYKAAEQSLDYKRFKDLEKRLEAQKQVAKGLIEQIPATLGGFFSGVISHGVLFDLFNHYSNLFNVLFDKKRNCVKTLNEEQVKKKEIKSNINKEIKRVKEEWLKENPKPPNFKHHLYPKELMAHIILETNTADFIKNFESIFVGAIGSFCLLIDQEHSQVHDKETGYKERMKPPFDYAEYWDEAELYFLTTCNVNYVKVPYEFKTTKKEIKTAIKCYNSIYGDNYGFKEKFQTFRQIFSFDVSNSNMINDKKSELDTIFEKLEKYSDLAKLWEENNTPIEESEESS